MDVHREATWLQASDMALAEANPFQGRHADNGMGIVGLAMAGWTFVHGVFYQHQAAFVQLGVLLLLVSSNQFFFVPLIRCCDTAVSKNHFLWQLDLAISVVARGTPQRAIAGQSAKFLVNGGANRSCNRVVKR